MRLGSTSSNSKPASARFADARRWALAVAAAAPLLIAFVAAAADIGAPERALGFIAASGIVIHIVGLISWRKTMRPAPAATAPLDPAAPADAANQNEISEIRDWHVAHAHLLGALKLRAPDETTRQLAAEAEESAHGALALLERLSELPASADSADLPLIPAHEPVYAAIRETRALALSRGVRIRAVRSSIKVQADPALAAALVKAMLVHAIVAAKGAKVLIGVRRVQSQARFEVWSMGDSAAAQVNTNGSAKIAARLAYLLGYRLIARGKSARTRGMAAIVNRNAR